MEEGNQDNDNGIIVEGDDNGNGNGNANVDYVDVALLPPPRYQVVVADNDNDGGDDFEDGGEGWDDERVIERLRQVIQLYPVLVWRAVGIYRWPLLHYAVFEGYSLPVIKFLLQANPESIRIPSNGGGLPLHYAGRESRLDVCQYLIATHPEVLRHTDDRGRIPLHVALLGAPPDIIRLYLQAWPESVRVRTAEARTNGDDNNNNNDEKGDLPIHCVASQFNRVDAAALVPILVRPWPESLLQLDAQGRTPLHLAADSPSQRDTVEAMIRELLQVDPRGRRALRMKDDRGCLPLHTCLLCDDAWGPDREARARQLLSEWEGAARVTNLAGELPLHCAARRGWCRELVRDLVRIHPESVLCPSNDGSIPIHNAVSAPRPDVDVARCLAESRPEALLVKNLDGLTPLHIVATRKGPNSMAVPLAELLIELSPESLLVPNSTDGSLPIHLAVAQDVADENLVRTLVNASSESLLVPDGEGYLPLHVAVKCILAYEDPVVPLLVGRSPGSLRVRDGDGNLPVHLAAGTSDVSLTSLRELVAPFPEALIVPNSAGRTPLNVAVTHACALEAQAERVVEEGAGADWIRRDGIILDALNDASHAVTVVGRLVDTYPDSLRVANSDGNLPVHLAASEPHASAEVLLALVQPWPESLHVANARGSVPLHEAVSHRNVKLEAVRVLIAEGGSATLQRTDAEGFTPLYLAAQRDAPLDVIFVLAATWPMGACALSRKAL